MSKATEVDIALGILDHQLVDVDGRNCGKVDDLEIAGLASGCAGGRGDRRGRQRLEDARPSRQAGREALGQRGARALGRRSTRSPRSCS